MLDVVTLIVVLSIIVCVCVKIEKSYVAPSVLLSVSFLPTLCMLLFYVDKWEVTLGADTEFYVLSAPCIFMVMCFICKKLLKHNIIINKLRTIDTIGNINIRKLLCFTIFEAISIILMLNFLSDVLGGVTTLSKMLIDYRRMCSNGIVKMPRVISFCWLVCSNVVDIWIIMILYYVRTRQYKNRKLLLATINYVLVLMFSSLNGARGTIIAIVVESCILTVLYLWDERYIWKKIKKYCIYALCVLFLFFQKMANWQGRVTSGAFWDYLAAYIAAPLVNLDWILKNGYYNSSIGLAQNRTFVTMINWLSFKLNKPEWLHMCSYPHRFIKGFYVGNVTTMYSNCLCDGGVFFFVFCVSLAAIFSSILYYNAVYSIKDNPNDISIYAILYAKIGFCLLFAFFADQFFPQFTIGFCYQIVALCFFKWFLCKARIKW